MVGTNSSIFRKGLFLVALPMVLELGMLGYILKVQQDAAAAQVRQTHTRVVIEQANLILHEVTNAHAALRGVAIFEDPAFERPAQALLGHLPADLAELKSMVANNPSQAARVDQAQGAAQAYLTWFSDMQRVAEARQWGGYIDRLKTYQGKRKLDVLQGMLNQFVRVEEDLDIQQTRAAEITRMHQRDTLLAAVAVTAVLAVAVVWMFARGIGYRLSVATDNAQRLAEGLPMTRPLAGGDEIARLDAVLHETGQRLAEAAASERHFTEQLRQRGQELEQANSELQIKSQENETFVYSVSHDLRSPLVNLQGFAQELTMGCNDLRKVLDAAQLPAAERSRIDEIIARDIVLSIGFIQSAVTRSSTIIDALLRLSRAGRVEYQVKPVPLQPIFERIVSAMRVSLDEKDAQVRIHPLPSVQGDPTAVEQIFANLLANAVNYLDPRRPGRIEVGTAETGANGRLVTIYVRDNGLGIPQAYLGKLFTAFQRLHGDVAPGEGVGLALVRRIVERHGGRVWAQSTEGEGSVFYVSLRKTETSEASAAPAAALHSEAVL